MRNLGSIALFVGAALVLSGSAMAQTESLLVSFTGTTGAAPGADPTYGNLIQANDGNLYGTTRTGGTNGYGTVFTVSATGTFTMLHSFSGATTDGQYPNAGLVQGTDGSFYGVASAAGASGYGVVFKISAAGSFTLLHSFLYATDGGTPEGTLVQGTDGNFYGTASSGGSSAFGTVFKVSATGTFTVLHSFGNSTTDGSSPFTGLVQGTDGYFYGTTTAGGANGYGTVYKITSTGAFTLLHSFSTATTDGDQPYGVLVQGTDANFYGTTIDGGANCVGCGTVYKVSSAGAFSLVHSFSTATTDGRNPSSGLVQGSDGNFYATTQIGGSNSLGTIFEVSAAGTFTLLHSFSATTTDGSRSVSGLVQGADGSFYGTTPYNGAHNDGNDHKVGHIPGSFCAHRC